MQDSDFAPNLSADDADEDNDEDSGGPDRPASEPDFDGDEVMFRGRTLWHQAAPAVGIASHVLDDAGFNT